jgi:serine/threonine-protein kinase
VEHEDGGKDDSDIVYYQDPEFGLCGIRECRLTSGQVKTPAELQNKIKQLDDMYRPKIDTALAPIEYREMPTAEEACTGNQKSSLQPTTATAVPKPKPAILIQSFSRFSTSYCKN